MAADNHSDRIGVKASATAAGLGRGGGDGGACSDAADGNTAAGCAPGRGRPGPRAASGRRAVGATPGAAGARASSAADRRIERGSRYDHKETTNRKRRKAMRSIRGVLVLVAILLLPCAVWAQVPVTPVPGPPSGQVFYAQVPAPPGHPLDLGKWWKNSRIARELGLSEAQISQIEQTFLEQRLKLIDLRADLEKQDRKSTRLNSSHLVISYAVFCLKKKKKK